MEERVVKGEKQISKERRKGGGRERKERKADKEREGVSRNKKTVIEGRKVMVSTDS